MIQTEENKANYKKKGEIKQKNLRPMRREAQYKINDLCNKPNNVFKLVKFLKKKEQDVNGG